jgi:hypothetical protein
VRRSGAPDRLGRLETVGAWLRIWTPPKDVEVPPVPTRKLAIAGIVGALVLAGAAAIVVPRIDSGKRAGARREARDLAARQRAERRRLAIDQRPHRGRAPAAASPAALVRDLELAITGDARQRVRRGQIDGPVQRTSCRRLEVSSEARLAHVLGRYTCMVTTGVDRSVRGYPFETGYPFIATIRYRDRSFVWCKRNPRAGEGAGPGVAAKLSRSCAGPYRDIL